MRDMAGRGMDNQTMAQKADSAVCRKRNLTQKRRRGFGAWEQLRAGRKNRTEGCRAFYYEVQPVKKNNMNSDQMACGGSWRHVYHPTQCVRQIVRKNKKTPV